MKKDVSAFESAKIGKNILWSHRLNIPDNEEYVSVKKPAQNRKIQEKMTQKKSEIQQEEIVDLQDVWTSIEEQAWPQQSNKIQIMSITNEPESLTFQEFEQVFGKENYSSPSKATEQLSVGAQEQQAEDFGDLWDQVNDTPPKKNQQIIETPNKKSLEIISNSPVSSPKREKPQQDLPQQQQGPLTPRQPQFYQIQEKSVKSDKVCLTLGKNFQIFNPELFLINCYQDSTYSYFGFEQSIPDHYDFYDISSRKSIVKCSVEPYDDVGENMKGKKVISFEKDFCLKMRLAESGELLATMWKKTTNSGTLLNLRLYNIYQNKYEQSLALIQIADGYIGNFCYCNTIAHLSQKYSKLAGPFKMRLSLKNGFLIAHMGVSGIKSAPYNCRLENMHDSFVYLLGMIDEGQFIVRVGEGMSPLVAFAISIGRKRYIDSFKQ